MRTALKTTVILVTCIVTPSVFLYHTAFIHSISINTMLFVKLLHLIIQ